AITPPARPARPISASASSPLPRESEPVRTNKPITRTAAATIENARNDLTCSRCANTCRLASSVAFICLWCTLLARMHLSGRPRRLAARNQNICGNIAQRRYSCREDALHDLASAQDKQCESERRDIIQE